MASKDPCKVQTIVKSDYFTDRIVLVKCVTQHHHLVLLKYL